jgi:hypothetical protein
VRDVLPDLPARHRHLPARTAHGRSMRPSTCC